MSSLSHITQYWLTPEDTSQAQRIFHGRGHAYDGLHDVTVDWLPPVALVTLYSARSRTEIELLARGLVGHLTACRSVQVQYRDQASGPVEVIWGEEISRFTVTEGDLQFRISLGQARNTGLFLDMQLGRRWVQENSRDQRVLNLFAYTCGFSVAAVAGGATSVLNVDMSRTVLSVGRENHRLNGQSLDAVRFEKLDIFKSFGRLNKRGPFDLLVCDPPTFQKGSVDIVRDYPKILRRVDQFMAPGATLVLCLNALEFGRAFLVDHMREHAPRYALVEEIEAPDVYVEAQGKGLTILVFRDGGELG